MVFWKNGSTGGEWKKRRAGPRTLKTSDWHFTKGHWTLDIGHWTREGRAKSKAQQILFPSCCLLPVAVRVLESLSPRFLDSTSPWVGARVTCSCCFALFAFYHRLLRRFPFSFPLSIPITRPIPLPIPIPIPPPIPPTIPSQFHFQWHPLVFHAVC